ncbi:MAG: hypoxanthine phosphoribosyltransferase [Defluviitaleaceae bacterium]|nr:hypoxanthine phosphoribosyltransferase [Defluviitaleaceae bacterium]
MDNISVLISEEEISHRVKEIGAQITRDYAGKSVTLLGTLKGGVIFLADLAREIKLDVFMEFIKVSSYGNSSESVGTVTLEYPEKADFTAKHIIIVEDIVDMGYTARWLREYLHGLNPASVRLCALLNKPERRKVAGVEIEYLGFTIPDEFVVGYGLDYAQKYRCLPYVGKLNLEVH